jgi:hypothetical protein
MKKFENVNELIAFVSSINNISANHYFLTLTEKKEKKCHLLKFYSSQHNFIYAVNEWSKVLSKLLSTASSYNQRRVILRNLNDENPQDENELSHVQTFQQFLNLITDLILNISKSDLKLDYKEHNHENLDLLSIKTDPVYDFISSMHKITDNPTNSNAYKYAFFGMIEFVYITVSEQVVKYMSQFIESNKIPHYSPHEILDIDHAKDLFSLALSADKNNNEDVINGIIDSYNVFVKLYSDMYEIYLKKSI